jgi:hypothetical protein
MERLRQYRGCGRTDPRAILGAPRGPGLGRGLLASGASAPLGQATRKASSPAAQRCMRPTFWSRRRTRS